MPEPAPFRLLVTGSRDWDDRGRVARELTQAVVDLAFTPGGVRPIVLIHGACPAGADEIAGYSARNRGWLEEPHPAGWEGPCRPECKPGHRRRRRDGTDYCPAAGNYRNEEMVSLGADVALAFLMPCSKRGCQVRRPHDSHGASDCAERADKAGIPVRRFRPGDTPGGLR